MQSKKIGLFLLLGCSIFFLGAGETHATVSSLIDFNTVTDLTDQFTADASPDFTNVATGGLANSGAINVPLGSTDIWNTKQAYTITGAGAVYTFSAFFKIQANSGYGGLGFTPETSSTGNYNGSPATGLGVAFHGGGAIFVNDLAETNVNWPEDLAIGSWYKIVLEVKATAVANTFNMDLKIYNSDANGVVGTLFTEKTNNNTANANIGGASIIHSYFSSAGSRVEYIDNFLLELDNGPSLVAAGMPFVTTDIPTSVTTTNAIAGGTVVTDQGSAITDRGVCYGTNPSPTLADTCVSVGGTTGAFAQTISPLTASTIYYVRAYATNATGTAYGNEQGFQTLPLVTDNSPPPDPTFGAGLQTASDTGSSNSDNITNDTTPTFNVQCDEQGARLVLFTNIPAPNTLIGTTFCSTIGATTITSTHLTDGTQEITYTSVDPSGNASGLAPSNFITVVTTNVGLSQMVTVPTPGTDTTPNYTFNSTTTGTISYSGSCSSATTLALAGFNPITFDTLALGTYSDCFIIVTDAAGNISPALLVNTFTISSPPPALTTATVNATTLVLTYDQTLDGASLPVPSDFVVNNGSAIAVGGVAISTATVTLTLASSVGAGTTVVVSYTPGLSPIQNATSDDAGALVTQAVTNNTAAAVVGGGSSTPYVVPLPPIFKYIAVDADSKKIADDIIAKISIEQIQKLSKEDINNLYLKPTDHSNLGLADCKPGLPIRASYNRKNEPQKVKELQLFLNSQGENVLVTGLYHQDDVLAVKRFEKKYNLPQIGEWGANEHDVASALACGFKITLKNLSPDLVKTCTDNFAKDLRITKNNDKTEVTKVQKFLEGELGATFPMYGNFGPITARYVVKFQSKYKDDILTPQSFSKPTGIWGSFTAKKANAIICQK